MDENQIGIKKATLLNLEELQNIGKKTFFETFSEENSKEDMEKYLTEKFSKKQLTSELKSVNSEFYFAVIAKEIVGYLKLNFKDAQTAINNEEGVEIERIYVLKKYQGKKIGQFLFTKAIFCANKKKVKYIWLGVWQENLKAIKFYQKNGFVEFDTHTFMLGNDEQIDILMKLDLSSIDKKDFYEVFN